MVCGVHRAHEEDHRRVAIQTEASSNIVTSKHRSKPLDVDAVRDLERPSTTGANDGPGDRARAGSVEVGVMITRAPRSTS